MPFEIENVRIVPELKRTRTLGQAAAQLRVSTAAYLASDATWSMAERTLAGQDFGNGIEEAGFNMLAPGMTESNITDALGVC